MATKSTSASSSRAGYVELPYTLPQDSTLFLVLRESTPEIWMRKLDWIAQHGGMVLLDVHPDYMSFDGSPQTTTEYPVALYREFLGYVKTRYAGEYWHALPKEVAAAHRRKFVPPKTSPANTMSLHPSKLAGCAAKTPRSCSSRTILRTPGLGEQLRH